MKASGSMLWDLSALPVIEKSGYFPMLASGFDHTYKAPTHAIHMYDYHAKFRIAGREYQLKPGDITFSPAGMVSAYKLDQQSGHWCIHFYLPEKDRMIQRLPLHLETGARAGYYRDRFKAIATYHNRGARTENRQKIFKARASAMFTELVLSLFDLHDDSVQIKRQRHSHQAIEDLLSYIESHLAESLMVPDLARRINLSHNYMAALFRESFGMSIQQYIQSRRIESAKHLLHTTAASIKVIGSRVGIPDAQHFNKCFRRHIGISPSRYRENIK